MARQTHSTLSTLLRQGANDRANDSRRFVTDRGGSTIVEFGLIALPLFLTIYAIIEIGYGNFVQSRLDAAVQQTSRLIMTGYVQNQTVKGAPLTAAQFRDSILCPKLPSTMNCADVFVKVETLDETKKSPFDSYVNKTQSGLAPPTLDNTNAYSLGGSKKYVIVQAVYPLPMITSILQRSKTATYKGRAVRLLQSTATFKNEPFPEPAGKSKG
jgi:pilus assembly protein Flp/PilA